MELWDADAWHALVVAQRAGRARHGCARAAAVRAAVAGRARTCSAGDLAAAAQALEEARTIGQATGSAPVLYTEFLLTAWQGDERRTAELLARETGEASARGMGRVAHFARYAAAVLYNGLGRYDAALEAAREAFAHDHLGYPAFVVPELAEAAARTGEHALVDAALGAAGTADRLGTRDPRRASGRCAGEDPERCYRESIERLGRTRVRLELARSRLLYGEWLRREGRRADAREQLRVAREAFLAMGADGFAERTRHELLATGEKVRKRRDDTRDELTPQEQHIARLARDGLTNPEIGAELFLSPRTVEWHLKKVFTKLGINSRRALRDALPEPAHA